MNASMTASYTRRSLLTVICEASIESLVAADARRLGAHGYTASDARGWGGHGERDGGWPLNHVFRPVELPGFWASTRNLSG